MTHLSDIHLPHPAPRTAGLLFGLAAAAMWASYLAFAQAGLTDGLAPLDILLLRFVTAGAIMLPWLLLHHPGTLAGVGWGHGIALASLAGAPFILIGISGYLYAPLAHGAVIQPATITFATMLLGWLVLGERLTRNRIAGAALLLGGLALVAGPSLLAGGMGAWRGDLMFVAAGLMWVAFTLLLRRWQVGALPATAIVATLSAPAVLLAWLALGDPGRLAAQPVSSLLVQAGVQGVASAVLAILFYGRAVELLGAGQAALFPALVPVATLALGLPVAGILPSGLEIAGGLLATLGLAVAVGALRLPLRRPQR